ncbi:Bug family tripartite tricarboxylate transporter substrate binding protein [Pigmentiphaga kullae]|uniref:Tripartite-type tricarboxylate transporter receptor subunit TctC n=1 Tax=Pigmentiphaga kullae TaxID=151784 RepID=A0A4Q7N9G1_9BURK|nr:tripartite tricarboxylate transporter substrate binding protein [Pigmentiphaga kullae]RZS78657.1 tripartite-type tricarboxylate transporter receptor subunit TctC [Pigmentiphaga kullae]
MKPIQRTIRALFVAAALSAGASAQAQSYPSRPVSLVTPFPPGGAADVVIRLMAQELGKELDATFIVDNRAGAGGAIGTSYVARANPDGYTLLLTSSSTMSINPHLTAKRPYDPFTSFTPISLVGYATNELVVTATLPYKTVGDVIAAAKAAPGKIAFGSNGVGTLSHLMGEMFMQQAGVKMLHVPYKGAAPAVADTAAGQVSVLFSNYASVAPMVKSGKLRGLAITSLKPTPLAPGLPTIAESGLPGFEANQWWGLWGPAGLPKEIVDKLNAAATKILTSPEAIKRFNAEGVDLLSGTPADLTAYLRADYDRWGQVVKAAGITPE